MPTNNGTDTYQRVSQMALTATRTGGPARYAWDDINDLKDAEVAAAEKLAEYWLTGPGNMNYPNEVAKFLREHGHATVAAEIRKERTIHA